MLALARTTRPGTGRLPWDRRGGIGWLALFVAGNSLPYHGANDYRWYNGNNLSGTASVSVAIAVG
jgi:hypothetical protein